MSRLSHQLKNLFNHIKHPHLTTPAAVLLGAFIIGASIIGYGFIMRDTGAKESSTMFTGRSIDEKEILEGKAKSKVFVVEYSDPECPFCVTVHPTLKQLRNEYADKITFVYRHYPLTQIHPRAFDESKAIECANTLGGNKKAFEYIDALYGYKSNQQTTQLAANGKEDIAKNVGLEMSAFTACMNSQATSDTINASINDGIVAGVTGTPSTFILVKTRKGYEVVSMVDGARPAAYFKAAIEEALSR